MLKQSKELFPKLFKGIGTKTMGKWSAIAGKAAGPVLMLAQSGFELWQAQKEEAREREHYRQFVAGVMSTLRQSLNDAVGQYELRIKQISKAVFDPLLSVLDEQAMQLTALSNNNRATRERLAAWTRDLDA